MNETIAAISTPFGEGAIAILRMSGPDALPIADRLFRFKRKPSELPARHQQFGRIVEGDQPVDEVVLCVYRAPASYTGEDLVEIQCHGGILVSRKILQLLLAAGARSAEPGEFTQRAFLNGKMDLTQAEAVMDVIKAQTTLALRAATEQLEGRLGSQIALLREGLLGLLAHVEAYIDFPEEDIDPQTGKALLASLEALQSKMEQLLRTADQGRVLREGVRTVIYGEPNVGKSSLLNLLLGYERAIVSDVAGTTRDTIEEVINMRGVPVRLVDTAGLRDSADEIELKGIERTRQQIERADLVLRVYDASRPLPAESCEENSWEGEPPAEPKSAAQITVLNKCDLGIDASWAQTDAVRISCLNGDGLQQLASCVFEKVMGGAVASVDPSIAINARHQALLQKAAVYCEAAQEALENQLSAEFIAVELRGAMDAVGEIVGKADTEELLGKIFSTFCIGK